jgi:hypothetical protein
MKALSIMGPLVLALAFGVIAMFVGGCNPSTGGKDAGDFCEDTCAVLTVCGKIRCDSPFAAPDESDCIDFLRDYTDPELFIRNTRDLDSFCTSLCNEISGEVEAVSTDCADALSDFWECNAETTTCPEIAPLPVLKIVDDQGGVFLPDIGDCEAESAVALEACEDDTFD